jgi:integrase
LYLQNLDDMTLLQLSCKLSMLFLLVTAQRCQTLHLIETTDITLSEDIVTIFPNHVLKQTKPGKHLGVIKLKAFNNNKTLCVVHTLKEYLRRTQSLRQGKKLLISTMKPHNQVAKSTVSRWVKLTLVKAGIDGSYGPHSTRSASTSKAKLQGVSLETIINTAGWANAKVFGQYYDKTIENDTYTFQEAILQKM